MTKRNLSGDIMLGYNAHASSSRASASTSASSTLATRISHKRRTEQQQQPLLLTVGPNADPSSWGKRTTRLPPGHFAKNAEPWTSADFLLVKKLGQGHFGQVFQAEYKRRDDNNSNADDDAVMGNDDSRDDDLHVDNAIVNYVALKRFCKSKLRCSQARGGSSLFLLKREVQIHTNVTHPHILPCYGYYQDPTHLSLVLDYCPAGDLLSLVTDKGMTRTQRLERCRDAVGQIASALQYLHNLQIAHRDLKPENMLLGTNKTVQLCDFGWAVWWHPGQYNRTLCGTAEYVPPCMLYKNSAGYRSYHASNVDAWALGIFAIEFLEGASLFSLDQSDGPFPTQDEQHACIFEKIRRFKGLPVPVETTETNADECCFWDLVSQLVQIDPEDRMQASEALEHDFLRPKIADRGDASPRSTMDTSIMDEQLSVAQRVQVFQETMLSSPGRE